MITYQVGDRVTIGTEGTTKGTVQQVVNPDHYLIVRWDDGTLGHVHPDDIRRAV